MDFYQLLNIPRSATDEEIKKAYRKKALLSHPDKGGSSEEFKHINIAYETLSDPKKKYIYDNPPQQSFNNILDSVFRNNPIFTTLNNLTRKTPPIIATLNVSLEDLCTRKIIPVQIPIYTPSPPCGRYAPSQITSSPVVSSHHTVHIHLSPEIEDNFKYIFQNEGNQDPNKLRGDIIIYVKHAHHPDFKIQNKNLLYTKHISLKEALTGFSFSLTHPSQEIVNINVSSVIKPDSIITVQGKGLSYNGSLIISFSILFPDTLSPEQIDSLLKIL